MMGRAVRVFLGESKSLAGVLVWGGIAIVLFFVFIAVFAPWVAPFDPNATVETTALPPSSTHWFGTNRLGQDILSRVIWGARIPLTVVALSAAIALAV
ncbi:MAG: ABC transporter permease, partial [Candidatus Eisenbacteria bacterium]